MLMSAQILLPGESNLHRDFLLDKLLKKVFIQWLYKVLEDNHDGDDDVINM